MPGSKLALCVRAGVRNWHKRNVHPHKKAGYSAVTLSLKKTECRGDATVEQMEKSQTSPTAIRSGAARIHEQNLIFADVQLSDLYSLWQR